MIDTLMLDVDGVLVGPKDGLHLFTDLERDLGLSLPLLQRRFFGPHWQDVVTGREPMRFRLAEVLVDIAPDLPVDVLIDYWFEHDAKINQSVLTALAAHRSAGLKIFLATNQEHLRARYLMGSMGLAEHVDGICYSADLGARKPDARFYSLAAERAASPADRNLLVDDTLANILAARAAGWKAEHWTGEHSLDALLARHLEPSSHESTWLTTS